MPKKKPKGPISCVNPNDAAASSKACASHPTYDPDLWNKNPAIHNSTNCYAYALNDPNSHSLWKKPQPGEHCGHPATGPSCAEVTKAAICDGLKTAPNPPPEEPGYYPVALVSAPGVDYHWYRMDSNGRWSSKPGLTDVTDLDAAGKPITNPETADRNYGKFNYTDFCGYFYVPAAGIRTGPPTSQEKK